MSAEYFLDEEKMIKTDFKDLMKGAAFRRFIWWLLDQTAPLQSQYEPDPYRHAYKAGKSDLGKQVMGLVLQNPDKYKQMQDERKSILKIREGVKSDDRTGRNDND
jgi:hypothetical protein